MMLVHPEAMHARLVCRPLIGLSELVVAAHHECAARYPCHVVRTLDTIADDHHRSFSAARRHGLAPLATRPGHCDADRRRYDHRRGDPRAGAMVLAPALLSALHGHFLECTPRTCDECR
ncbi:hypothetical protein CBM2631_B180072 [Cupriavidus taiwanensis]|nr:hypothetical protein CBM2588_B190069 [Cupriavidus taiwanensis]SOZ71735.1 hypothetical protein CBM2617_B180072 [Cupriavidus taiwanensis]SOZ90039.1 hypothetical protein CBM2622_B190072 [Cupriavidus taiwanensis]SOZ94624.1 hypothetical protein CBM2621_B190069 [Cupriavidus taiwanensis]SPA20363.1 hypothetical protein CBM2631_B180072 [Cupriavidus taiwanensis]